MFWFLSLSLQLSYPWTEDTRPKQIRQRLLNDQWYQSQRSKNLSIVGWFLPLWFVGFCEVTLLMQLILSFYQFFSSRLCNVEWNLSRGRLLIPVVGREFMIFFIGFISKKFVVICRHWKSSYLWLFLQRKGKIICWVLILIDQINWQ